jgi:hypothetical protein
MGCVTLRGILPHGVCHAVGYLAAWGVSRRGVSCRMGDVTPWGILR